MKSVGEEGIKESDALFTEGRNHQEVVQAL